MRCASGAFLRLEALCATAALPYQLHGPALLPLALKEEMGEKSRRKMTPSHPFVTL